MILNFALDKLPYEVIHSLPSEHSVFINLFFVLRLRLTTTIVDKKCGEMVQEGREREEPPTPTMISHHQKN